MEPVERWIRDERARQEDEERQLREDARARRLREDEEQWSDRTWAAENAADKASSEAKEASRDLVMGGAVLLIATVANEIWGPWHSFSSEYQMYGFAAVVLIFLGRAQLRNRAASDAQARLLRIVAQRPR
jgi:hypothetical protein